jgi:hypothetical protein
MDKLWFYGQKRVLFLTNQKTGTEYIKGKSFFKKVFQKGYCFQPVFPAECNVIFNMAAATFVLAKKWTTWLDTDSSIVIRL